MVIWSVDKMTGRIFISYDTETGLEYAREARRVLTDAGYQTWMWHTDRVTGAYTAEEISKNIKLCDTFFYLCTAPSETEKRNGQPFERNLAWTFNRPVKVLTFDRDFVPFMLMGSNYKEVSVETFATECQKVALEIAKGPTLDKLEPAILGEAEALDKSG